MAAKACESDHDMRFDIPVGGPETVRAMKEAGVGCLGLEAGRVLLLNRPELIAAAADAGLAMVAF